MKTYFARLVAPRPTFVQDMTAEERQLMNAHGQYWRELLARGLVVTFGMVMDPAGAFGVGILELPDGEDVHAITGDDPTIRANAGFRFEVSPMPMGAVHK